MDILDDKEEELKRAFLNFEKHLLKPTIQTQAYIGEVDKSNWMTSIYMLTTTSKGAEEKVYYYEIPLKVIYNSANQPSIVEIPKADSICIVSFMYGDPQCARLVSVQEIDEYIWKIEDSEFNFNKDGFELKNGASGLKKTLNDLITAIKAITVPTGTGPSGIPINGTQFDQIATDLDNYLI